MLAHSIPFPTAPLPTVVVAPTVAVLGPMLAVNAPPNAEETSDNDDLVCSTKSVMNWIDSRVSIN